MSGNKTLIIWLSNGTTCRFEEVTELRENGDYISFYYFGVSTQVARKAVFQRNSIAGYALEK